MPESSRNSTIVINILIFRASSATWDSILMSFCVFVFKIDFTSFRLRMPECDPKLNDDSLAPLVLPILLTTIFSATIQILSFCPKLISTSSSTKARRAPPSLNPPPSSFVPATQHDLSSSTSVFNVFTVFLLFTLLCTGAYLL